MAVTNITTTRTITSIASLPAMRVDTLSAATTLEESDNNTSYTLNDAAGHDITLPALKDGLRFRFTIGAAFATSNWRIVSPVATKFEGSVIVAGAVVAVTSQTFVRFKVPAESIGDFVEVQCDGSNWHVFGNGAIAASIDAST